ncbi:MAG: protease inhibitor I42 family protein [Methanomassiliicoccales archaeon]|jgi:inhibitor of cysteine peptidase
MTIARKLVGKGEKFDISLEENPTTGYVWEATYDKSYIGLLKKIHQRTTDAIGGGGRTLFTFVALQEGNTVLRLRLVRPWEGKEIETLDYDIVIS